MAQDYSKILKIISGVSEEILKEREQTDDPREQLYLTYQSIGVHRVQKAISEAFERGDLT